jgi:dihydropteroate synthase
MTRKHFGWKLRERTLWMGERTLILGAINVAPEAGAKQDPDRVLARALELEDAGADVLDIGAESARATSSRISEAEELRRLAPVLKRLRGELRIPVSVDTWKANVAEKALELGAEVINDPSALTWDPLLAKVVVKHDAGLILNHVRGTPETWAKQGPPKDIVGLVVTELEASIHRAGLAGLGKASLVVDPGLGFGKRREQNIEIIDGLHKVVALGAPVLVGTSHKPFLAKADEVQAEYAAAAALTASILRGVHMVRVHDVRAMKAAADVADLLLSLRPAEEKAAAGAAVKRALPGPADPAELKARLAIPRPRPGVPRR